MYIKLDIIQYKNLIIFEWEKGYYVGPYTQSHNGSIWLNGKLYFRSKY